MKYAVIVGLVLGLNIFTPGEAVGNHCEATVMAHLDRLNVEPSEIREIRYLSMFAGSKRGEGHEVDTMAWVQLHSCEGSVIIGLTKSCRVRQVYGRGECDLGGAIKIW